MFVAAGWHPQRRVPVLRASATHSQALALAVEILQSVGGLCVGESRAGVACAASDVRFGAHLAEAREAEMAALFPSLGNIASIGDAANDRAQLFINSEGSLLVFTDPDSRLYVAGSSIAEGIDRLLLGHIWAFPWGRT